MADRFIAAQPGWRVCVWSREHGSEVELHIVAWEEASLPSAAFSNLPILRPWVRSEFGEQVAPLREDEWFVGIMAPGETLYDWQEQAAEVAKTEREAEERAAKAAES